MDIHVYDTVSTSEIIGLQKLLNINGKYIEVTNFFYFASA